MFPGGAGAGGGGGGESGESTPVSVGSEKCVLDEPTVTRAMKARQVILGEDQDEEKTLTGHMREETNRPRLAEIKWTNNDVLMSSLLYRHGCSSDFCYEHSSL